jgi:hypothetical protein
MLFAGCISQPTDKWMAEAATLESLGMPAGQFVLVLDGDPLPEMMTEIFSQAVQDKAAVQRAVGMSLSHDELRKRKLLATGGDGAGLDGPMFPRLVEDLVRDRHSGIIRCNFELEQTLSASELFEAHLECHSDTAMWSDLNPGLGEAHYQTEPPLPPWSVMLKDNVILERYLRKREEALAAISDEDEEEGEGTGNGGERGQEGDDENHDPIHVL